MKYVWVPDRRAAALRLSGMTGGDESPPCFLRPLEP
jgi:hypothetical protein